MPLFDLFWSMLWFFLFIAWIWVMISVMGDIFRSRDMGGGAKALWMFFVIVFPWLGVLVYFFSRGDKMAERSYEAAAEQERIARAFIQDAAGSTSPADELKKLSDLKNSGVINDAEFEAQKVKILA